MKRIKTFFSDFLVLLRSVPPLAFSFFLLSVFSMNLLANKSIDLPLSWLALDCGIVVSWISFLCMDVLTRHFGPRAATELSVFAAAVNLVLCLILYLSSLIPGTWGAFFDFGEQPVINDALDRTVGGTWYVVLGSTLAFLVSAAVNNFTNWGVGKLFKRAPNGFGAYACRTYLSTAVGQFTDNMVFAFVVSHFFFGWTAVQCVTCAATGMVAELLIEAIFSPIGFRVAEGWRKRGVGREYFERISKAEEAAE